MLVAGHPPAAPDGLDAVVDGKTLVGAFLHMPAIKAVHMVSAMLEIHADARGLFQIERFGPMVFHAHTPGDQIQVFQDAVIKMHIEEPAGVFQCDDQGVGQIFLCGVDCGKTGQCVFPFLQSVARIAQFTGVGAVRIADLQCSRTVVAASVHRIFLGQRIQGIGAFLPCVIGIAGKSVVCIGDQIRIVKRIAFFSIVGVEQDAILIDFHLVHAVVCLQCENGFRLID